MDTSKKINLQKFVADPELFFEESVAELVVLTSIEKEDEPVTYENVIFMVNEMSNFSYLIDEEGKLHQIPNDRVLEIVRPKSYIALWKRLQMATIADTMNQVMALENSLISGSRRRDL